MPKSLGGQGDGQNPEQLFAMGYACMSSFTHLLQFLTTEYQRSHPACFLGALQMMAGRMGKKDAANNAVIHVNVHLGEAEKLGGFGLAVDIKVGGVEDEELIKAGHDVRASFYIFCSEITLHIPCRLAPTAVRWRMAQLSMFPRREWLQ